jgi:hypothetical protein
LQVMIAAGARAGRPAAFTVRSAVTHAPGRP